MKLINVRRMSERFGCIGLCIASGLLPGCFYEVRDARTGQMYYSNEWIAADGYRGPLTFTDHTGRRVRMQHAEVVRIGKRDYLEATETAPEDHPAAPPP